ncbi:hypothetical protein DSM43276_02685 [Mycobacteroides salmoniphilum]|nr:hypothetical protein DSM43276_02685 [Mycobacteroides salmoniphilum]
MSDEFDDWVIVQSSALTPTASLHAVQRMSPQELESLDGRPPIALLTQRCGTRARVVYGKVLLTGTVIPVSDDAEFANVRPWTTTAVEVLTPGISAGSLDAAGLLMETDHVGGTRVCLGWRTGSEVVALDGTPVQRIMFEGAWDAARKALPGQ